MIEEKFGKAMEAGGKLRVRSALNPILWLCLIISAPSIAIAVAMENPPNWLIFLIYIPVSVASLSYVFLMFFDRDKLQSEEYQIKKQSLEIYQKGISSPVSALIDDVVENPEISTEYKTQRIDG